MYVEKEILLDIFNNSSTRENLILDFKHVNVM